MIGWAGRVLPWLIILVLGASAGSSLAATMGPEPAAGDPGTTVSVPVVLALGTDEADRMAFSLEVTPNGSAPARTTDLRFSAAVPGGSVISHTTTFISVAWFSTISPPLTGTVQLGSVLVDIPATAAPGDTYTVHMVSVGASLGPDELPVTKGPDVLVTVTGAVPGSDITITVTLANLGVVASPETWDLRTPPVPPEESRSSWVSGSPGGFYAENTGNVAEDLTISPSSTSPSEWDPGLTAAVDVYLIGFGFGTDPYTTEPEYTVFTTATLLASNVPATGSNRIYFDLMFQAPSMGSTFDPDGESFALTVEASQH